MKKLFFITAFLFSYFFNINAQKDRLDLLFEKYQESEGVTSIKIAKPMFNMLNKLDIDDSELDQIKPLLSKIDGLKILILEKPAPGKTGLYQNLQNEISTSIKNMKYEELITVNSKENKIKFLSSDAANGILDDLLLSINSDDNTVLMMLDGKISMDDVNRIVNETENYSSKTNVVTENFSKNGVTQMRNVSSFSGISVSNGVKVNFTQGNQQSVVVETDPDLQQYVSIQVENNILVISVKNKNDKNLKFKKLLVTVEAPHLSSVKLSSGSLLTTLNTIKEKNFRGDVSSGANLNAEIKADAVEMEINSGANTRLDINSDTFKLSGSSGSMSTVVGETRNAFFSLSSAAACNAQDLESKMASFFASSGSNLKIQAGEKISGNAASGSSVRYKGKPRDVSGVQTSSGGTVKPLN